MKVFWPQIGYEVTHVPPKGRAERTVRVRRGMPVKVEELSLSEAPLAIRIETIMDKVIEYREVGDRLFERVFGENGELVDFESFLELVGPKGVAFSSNPFEEASYRGCHVQNWPESNYSGMDYLQLKSARVVSSTESEAVARAKLQAENLVLLDGMPWRLAREPVVTVDFRVPGVWPSTAPACAEKTSHTYAFRLNNVAAAEELASKYLHGSPLSQVGGVEIYSDRCLAFDEISDFQAAVCRGLVGDVMLADLPGFEKLPFEVISGWAEIRRLGQEANGDEKALALAHVLDRMEAFMPPADPTIIQRRMDRTMAAHAGFAARRAAQIVQELAPEPPNDLDMLHL